MSEKILEKDDNNLCNRVLVTPPCDAVVASSSSKSAVTDGSASPSIWPGHNLTHTYDNSNRHTIVRHMGDDRRDRVSVTSTAQQTGLRSLNAAVNDNATINRDEEDLEFLRLMGHVN